MKFSSEKIEQLKKSVTSTSEMNFTTQIVPLWHDAAIALPLYAEAIDWKPISTIPRNQEVEVWSKYRQHMGVATFTDKDVVPDTLTHWRYHVKPEGY